MNKLFFINNLLIFEISNYEVFGYEKLIIVLNKKKVTIYLFYNLCDNKLKKN